MKFIQLLVFSTCFFYLSSCSINKAVILSEKHNKGTGSVISKEIPISDYIAIEANSIAHVIYNQDLNAEPYLRYEIDENLLNYVDIKVNNNKLIITAKENLTTQKFKVYTNSPHLEKLSLSGAASFEVDKPIQQKSMQLWLSGASYTKMNKVIVDKLNIQVSGASDMLINQVDAQSTDLQASGSSDVKITGNTQYLKLGISGSSDVKAFDLIANTVKGSASGASDVHIQVTDSLIMDVSGASDVTYKGTPPYNQIHTSGGSSIKRAK